MANKLRVSFPTVLGKEICQIEVSQAQQPIILKVADKSGQQVEKFYVRSGNSSIEERQLLHRDATQRDAFIFLSAFHEGYDELKVESFWELRLGLLWWMCLCKGISKSVDV